MPEPDLHLGDIGAVLACNLGRAIARVVSLLSRGNAVTSTSTVPYLAIEGTYAEF
jgi:hypothetical protein